MRERAVKAKRAHLTPNEMRDMLERQGGVCFMPSCMSEGPFIGEHYTPVALGNASKPDCLLCEPCAKKKTYGLRGDISNIAKVKRLNGTTSSQWSRREENGSRLKSRGFTQWRGLSKQDVRSK
jgi:hypothetical protein